jgi:CRP/FNR family transcriptional regulator, cyclic AMP receptor protein
MMGGMHREHAFSGMFVAYLLTRNNPIRGRLLIDQLFNSREKRLARVLLLLAHFGKDGKPEVAISLERLRMSCQHWCKRTGNNVE